MSETCANGCIPSSPRVGCPVHGPKAKPPEPEDLPHPGTGRLLSASPVKPPEPARVYSAIEAHPRVLALEIQLAAAQARTEELKREVERRDELLHGADEDLNAATERAEKACEERLMAERSRAIAYEERDAERKRADEERVQANEWLAQKHDAEATEGALRAALERLRGIIEYIRPHGYVDALAQINAALAAHSKAVGP